MTLKRNICDAGGVGKKNKLESQMVLKKKKEILDMLQGDACLMQNAFSFGLRESTVRTIKRQ